MLAHQLFRAAFFMSVINQSKFLFSVPFCVLQLYYISCDKSTHSTSEQHYYKHLQMIEVKVSNLSNLLTSKALILLGSLLVMISACSPKVNDGIISYDPEGATVTTDKSIETQHKRTIGVSSKGVWITNEFPTARMNDFYQAGKDTFKVLIEPEIEPVNNSPWYGFKMWADSSTTITLQLAYEHGSHRYIPKFSRDGEEWIEVDTANYSVSDGNAYFEVDLTTDPLWISAQPSIGQDEYRSWVNSVTVATYVSVDTVGYSHQGRAIEKVTINETKSQEPKGVLLLTGRLHPPEITGQLALFYFIEELLGNSELASDFRENFVVFAYPFANPDGVAMGHWRTNAKGVDLNRDWINFNQPETKAIKFDIQSSVARLFNAKVFYGMDFHSTQKNVMYPIIKEHTTFPEDFTYRWIEDVKSQYGDTLDVEPFDVQSPITKNWIYREFGTDAVTFEVGDTTPDESIRELARLSADAIMKRLLKAYSGL